MKISIVVPITRKWAIPHVIENINRLECLGLDINVLLYIDSTDRELRDLVIKNVLRYSSDIAWSDNQPTMERKVSYRRNRIVEMKQHTAKLVNPCDYVFSFEDDTVVPPDALKRLLALMSDNVGFAQGVQCGRWDLPMLGVWRVDNIDSPNEIHTVPLSTGVQEVDAGGFYCYLTPYDLYTGIPYRWHDECFGPDVCYGLDVRATSLLVLTDFDLHCGHMTNHQTLYPNGSEKQLSWKLRNGDWIRQFSFLDLKKSLNVPLNDLSLITTKSATLPQSGEWSEER